MARRAPPALLAWTLPLERTEWSAPPPFVTEIDAKTVAGAGRALVSRLRRQAADRFFAGCLAPPAGLGADAAVLVVAGVRFALARALAAGLGARLQRRPDHADVSACAPGGDAPGGSADVGAVQVETDALRQRWHLVLAEAGVGAGRAGRGAVEAQIGRAHV